MYGGVDWVAMAMSANESDDLTDPAAWAFADPPLGNPAAVYSNELRALFDVAFRADKEASCATGPARPACVCSAGAGAGAGGADAGLAWLRAWLSGRWALHSWGAGPRWSANPAPPRAPPHHMHWHTCARADMRVHTRARVRSHLHRPFLAAPAASRAAARTAGARLHCGL